MNVVDSAMSTTTLDRIVQLWPRFSEEEREKLVEIAENIAEADTPLELSPDEELLLEQSCEGFGQGRTLSLDELDAELDVLFDELRAATPPPASRPRR